MKKYRAYDWCIGLVVILIELGLGLYWNQVQEVVMGDNSARVANTFYMLFIEPRKFASIGLVWTPLPSLLNVPFVRLSAYWKPLAIDCLAGVIVTAICSGVIIVLMQGAFRKFRIPKYLSLPLTVLYCINPFVLFYGANGMSEVVFFVFMMYMMYKLCEWLEGRSSSKLMCVGIALALMFFCRYEAIPIGAGVGVGLLCVLFFDKREQKEGPPKTWLEKYYYFEATCLVVFIPLAYSILIWMLFNWVISGNALYFLNSNYSNKAFAYMTEDRGSVIQTLGYSLERVRPFIPLFLGIVGVRVFSKRRRHPDIIILVGTVAIIFIFHYLMLLNKTSYGWIRFFAYALPLSFAWVPYELSKYKGKKQIVTGVIFAIALTVSGVLTLQDLRDPLVAVEEQGRDTKHQSDMMATYINENLQGSKILVDCFAMGDVIMRLDDPCQLVTSVDENFNMYLANPLAYDIEYILIPAKEEYTALNAINQYYPDLHDEKLDWCEVVVDYNNYKIFRVKE